MASRGQRFHIDLDLDSDHETDHLQPTTQASKADSFFSLVKDVQERAPSNEVEPPSPPSLKNPETGFPTHRKRVKPSAFKQGLAKKPTSDGATQTKDAIRDASIILQDPFKRNGQPLANTVGEWVDSKIEHQRISDENDQKLAQMSQEEIEEAQEELLSGLNPSVLEALLKKADIDDGHRDVGRNLAPLGTEQSAPKPKRPSKKVTFDAPERTASTTSKGQTSIPPNADNAPQMPPSDLLPPSENPPPPIPGTITVPPQLSNLDPSSPSFLSDLHSKYFPSLPADPSRLSWMQPIPASSSYSPNAPSLPPSALRFDFCGHLLPPRLSAQLPSAMGLHHHSSAPGSAGYTIPELAHLARSSFPSQRCIAMQTLGRILFRLGRGDFGEEVVAEEEDGEEGGGGALCEGLWNEMEKGRVIDGLVEAAGGAGEFKGGNRSVWVTATEAVWNWRKGGGRTLK